MKERFFMNWKNKAAQATFMIGVLLSSCFPFQTSVAQTPPPKEDVFSMSLEDVLNTPVQVASKGVQQNIRQAPGSVTVIDANFIKESGARDLRELLENIPGFQFGTDVGNGELISFRGGISTGGILLRIDGMDMNELLFNNIELTNNYPTSIIERVEIIRGPGSVLYGESAEYAVIEVTTKKPTSSQKGLASVSSGTALNELSRLGGTVWASEGDEDHYISISGSKGRSIRGSGDYNDFYGGSFNMEDDAELFQNFYNMSAKAGDFSLKYIRDRYVVEQHDCFALICPFAIPEKFEADRAELAYNPKLSDSVSGLFQLYWSNDKPWVNNGESVRQVELSDPDSYAALYLNKHIRRLSLTSELTYHPDEQISAILGTKYFDDQGGGIDLDGSRSASYDAKDEAAYAQLTYSPGFATVTAGTRYEHNDNYGAAVVSRLALTKAESDWHSKLQLAQSFRAPGFANTVSFYDPTGQAGSLDPEKTVVTEAEFGHVLTSELYATINLFDWRTADTVTYFYDPNHGDSFGNLGDTGARGVEANLRYQLQRASLNLTYAFQRANSDNEASAVYGTDGNVLNDHEFIGQSPSVVTLTGSVKVTPKLNFFTAAQYFDSRYAYTSVTEDDILVVESLSPFTIWKSNVLYKGLVWDNLDLQLGVNNILNERSGAGSIRFASDYHPMMPRLGREFFLNASVKW